MGGRGRHGCVAVIASVMERELGKPVNVVNRTGGSGVVGHQAIAGAPADGYTIGIMTVEIAMMHHQGLTDLSGASFTPLGLANFDATAIQVRADAPYRNLATSSGHQSESWKAQASGTAQGESGSVATRSPDDQKYPVSVIG